MNKYIFLTNEGYTYESNSESVEPDNENAQVIGIVAGNNENEAFDKLLEENEDLKNSNFNEVYCYKLSADFNIKYFYLKNKNI